MRELRWSFVLGLGLVAIAFAYYSQMYIIMGGMIAVLVFAFASAWSEWRKKDD